MEYTIKAHKTFYNGVWFRSRLEARWAAFFDLIGWQWEYEPIDLVGWSPDFRLEFQCGHSECPPNHVLLAEVKPYFCLDDFNGHPCMSYSYGHLFDENGKDTGYCIPADGSAAFGANPDVTYWDIVHGSGSGVENIYFRVEEPKWKIEEFWKTAGNITQYHP